MRTLAGRLVTLAAASAIVLALDASTQIARAQEQAPNANAHAIFAVPNTSGPPVVTNGCWQGNVFNDAQGSGTITFFFKIKGKKIVKPSTYDIEYTSEGLTESGPIKGKVTSTKFQWKGPAVGNQGSQCKVFGSGAPTGSGFLDGSYTYTGKCTEVSGPHNPFTGGDMGKLVFTGPTC